jgi:signal peptidase II
VYHGLWSFPAFNVADSAITVGGALLVIELLWPHHRIDVPNQTEVVQK